MTTPFNERLIFGQKDGDKPPKRSGFSESQIGRIHGILRQM